MALKMWIKVARTAETDQSTWHRCSERSVTMSEPCGVFIWLLAGADGVTDKRLVQVTSLRNRFTCEFGQGFRSPLIEEASVIHRVCLVPAGNDGVTPQILQRKDQQTAFHLRRIQEGTSRVDCSSQVRAMRENRTHPLSGLSSVNEQLRQENEYMRSQLEYFGNSDPGDPSRPAKRQRFDYHGYVL
jgi:hypothetical protein